MAIFGRGQINAQLTVSLSIGYFANATVKKEKKNSIMMMMISWRSNCILVAVLLALGNVVVDATKELDSTSFEELTKSGKNGMVKFFQPWCGHCTAMKPAWDQLAESVDASVFIADVNCSDQDDLCSKNEVKGYPTIKVYKDGEVSDYKGGRSFEDLMEYVDENLAQKCNVEKLTENCSEKAVKYADKWKSKPADDVAKELKRLNGMTDSSMSSDLKKWLRERLHILRQLAPPMAEDEEL